MTPIERMFTQLEKQGKSMQNLCDHLHISSSVLANWKSRSEIPPSKYIVTICEYLNVSSDFLLTGIEKKMDLNPNQEMLLDILNNVCDEKEQLMLIGATDSYAKTLSSYSKNIQKAEA